jgi:integrase
VRGCLELEFGYRRVPRQKRKEKALTTARYQKGCISKSLNGSGTEVWIFRWYELLPDGQRIRRKRQIGTLADYKTKSAAEKAVLGLQLAINTNNPGEFRSVTMRQLIQHFREKELVEKGEDGRAWSTRDRYECYLRHWIDPRWGDAKLDDIKTPMVEEWLSKLQRQARNTSRMEVPQMMKMSKIPLARATKAKIRNLMSVLFNHGIRWDFAKRNPISGPCKGSGVRQSSKRMSVPDVLDIVEIQAIIGKLQLRERVMLFLDMATGLRRGELCGIKWKDIDFDNLLIDVQRSVVDQVIGRCKTEASQKPVPLDEYTASDLLDWFRYTQYRDPEDWVFASNSNRAGSKRGKQPLWLSTVMRYHIQPAIKELGITKRVSWHTFRHTYSTLLKANGEDVKVVQELLRHGSSRITLDVYTQAQMPAKRAAQQKLVAMIRQDAAALSAGMAIQALGTQ